MADRRMFAKSVIGSDKFLEMPATAQRLYFHLVIRADNDGHVPNVQAIMRMCGANDCDLESLIKCGYVDICEYLEGKAAVINDWATHTAKKGKR